MSIYDINVIAWIPEETVAKICPKEYMRWHIEFKKLEWLSNSHMQKIFWLIDVGMNFKEELSDEFLNGEFNFAEKQHQYLKESNFKIFYLMEALMNEFESKTSQRLGITDITNDFEIYCEEKEFDQKKFEFKQDKLKWFVGAYTNLEKLVELNATTVAVEI